jgi:hypothetical protein
MHSCAHKTCGGEMVVRTHSFLILAALCWRKWLREKAPPPPGIKAQFLGHPVHSLIPILTELFWLCTVTFTTKQRTHWTACWRIRKLQVGQYVKWNTIKFKTYTFKNLKIYPSITAIFVENLILLSSFYSPLGDMFRHKCHHQTYVNQLKHKLSNVDTMSCLLRT